MTKMDNTAQFSVSRRALLKAGGALVVSIGAAVPLDTALAAGEALAQGAKPPLMPDQLASFIAVNADGTVSAFFGKMDMGQGLFVAIGQMVAEELDVPFKAVKAIMGDTATSVNQGGASGSTGIQRGGMQMRMAAAEARRVLVEMAAAKLGLVADALTVSDGVVHAKDDASKRASYAELIGGRYFNVQLDWNKEWGNTLYAPGKAKPKDPKDYKIVGQAIAREDIAPTVYAQADYCTDVKRPNMLHGRMIRPPVAGAVPVKVDEASIRNIPGARVVWEKGFLGVVADKEWDAIRAADKLKVEWSDAKPPFPNQTALYDHIRNAPVRKREIGGKEVGNVDEAFKTAARVIEADYEWPFQSHACMGPACAVVEINEGNVTCWTGSQKPHFVRDGIALTLGVPAETVRAIWVVGPGSYGRSDADDAAMDAAVLAKAVGKPVRVQYTRDQATGWDPKGPASTHRARAAIDAAGNVIAYEFTSKGFSRIDVNTNGGAPKDTLAGHSRGTELTSADGFGVPAESYEFAAEKAAWQARPSPRKDQTGAKVSGRGIAYAQRNGTRCAVIAEVDIDRASGKIWARKFTVAHDCGQIINPGGLKYAIEGNVVQGVSRTLWEEVKFDAKNVTSIDWMSYPILDITETPEAIEVVLINHPELPPTGAGEPSIRPVAAAIANAIFDATGVRIRRVPFSPDRVKQSLS